MIVGGYQMHLYCENPYSELNMKSAETKEMLRMSSHNGCHEYAGESAEDCRKQAREAGWKLNLQTNQCWCSKHK